MTDKNKPSLMSAVFGQDDNGNPVLNNAASGGPSGDACYVCNGVYSMGCCHCDGMGIEPRKMVGYGNCKCVLSQYCDGKCNPIWADEQRTTAPPAQANATPISQIHPESAMPSMVGHQATMASTSGELPPLPEWSKRDDLGGLVPSEIRQAMREYGAACVAAARSEARAAPAGEAVRDAWKWVPVEPTHAMGLAFAAGQYSFQYEGEDHPGMLYQFRHQYACMLAAAPSHPVEPAGGEGQ